MFDKLQKRLAAVRQALAFLDLVEKGDRFSREIHRHFPVAGGRLALAKGSDVLCDLGSAFHRREFDSVTSKLNVRLEWAPVYRILRPSRA
jgi:hypothetical protein